ncbi:hypothetical protein H7347_01200 [Corynebacterium sp. zg-331]|uniref:hypothetical protein n=1 Tax=unclassified Corynebacterium TaxID=2624378 RepID=UPI00128DFEF9|nr:MULTISPECIES: hypothetical protein [unclassified Corynebacterium]MBC3185203.1 hypothetical protein [Corynebacterium sp. zg-331]MPV51701.1 hypothetical protein [Corynebacterium sp. zg331]
MKKILVGRMVVALLLIVAYVVMAAFEFHHLEAGPIFFVLIGLVMFIPLPGAARAGDSTLPRSEEGTRG